jgi:nucleotide-binding universal stress UspA family protein
MAIFCTSDGSIRSLHALPHAALLARITGEELALAGLLDEAGLNRAQTEALLTGALQRAGAQGRVIVEERLARESTADALLRAAGADGARLIACDTRGAGLLRHALIGSAALELLQKSPVPVLMTGPKIEDPVEQRIPRYHVALATDGAPEAAARLGLFSDLLAMPGIAGSVVAISVPVLREVESAMADLEKRCRAIAAPLGLEAAVARAEAFEKLEASIIRLAQAQGASAIGFATANSSLGRHVFRGSLSLATLNRSPLPIILKRADD